MVFQSDRCENHIVPLSALVATRVEQCCPIGRPGRNEGALGEPRATNGTTRFRPGGRQGAQWDNAVFTTIALKNHVVPLGSPRWGCGDSCCPNGRPVGLQGDRLDNMNQHSPSVESPMGQHGFSK